MLLFIEGYPYSLDDVVRDGLTVRDVLKDVCPFLLRKIDTPLGM